MSRTIDSRVVEMQFDNKQFEQNVSTSMSTLEKLKRSLNMEGASKGLENVGAAAKNCDMSGLSGAVETVRIKFSALEVMAVTALANITNSAINAGKRIVSALIIEPISDGFKEYEMTMQAVQTTMAGTGKTAEEVQDQLKKLDKYADDTVYSSADMFNNLPKFTNAGVELDKAVTAMIGIANATALAGGDANKASIAFYNLGQSIANGYLTRIDYNSINNAGIATMEWKKQMVEAAIAQGTLTKTGEDAYRVGNKNFTLQSLFIDGLQEQWASTEVLMSVFEDYGDATTDIGKKALASAKDLKTFTMMMESLKATAGTGWKDTWQLIFGDLDEAKALWTNLGNTIGEMITKSSEARNKMLQGWKDLGGRDALIESFKNSFEALEKVIKPIHDAFRDIFPPTTGEKLLAMTKGLEAFTEKLKIGDETADKIKRTFSGLFAVLDLVKDAFGFVLQVAGQVFSLFGGSAAGGILGITASLGDFIVKLHDAAEAGNIFGKTFEKIQEIFTTVADKIKDAISRIGAAFQGFNSIDMGPLDDFSEHAEKSFSPFTRLGEIFSAAFEAIVRVLEWAAPIAAKLGSIIGKALGSLADTVSYSVEHMEFNEILDMINTGLFGAILLGIRNFIKSLTKITSGAGDFLKGITDILDGVRGCLEAYQSKLKADALLKIASAIAILVGALAVLSMIPSEKLTTALMGITVLFIELTDAMTILGKTLSKTKIPRISFMMIAMSTAILILSNAMKNLADLDYDGLAKGIVGIAALAATLVMAANSFDKTSGKLIKGSTGLIAFATAVLILSHAVDNLAQLSWEGLVKGLVGLTIVLTEIVALAHLMGDAKRMISTGLGMIALGAAINIFASAIAKMGQLSWGEIARGLTTMAGALTAVTIALNFMPKGMINKATGLLILGTAMQIFASAVTKMGELSWNEIAKGITAMAGALLAVTVAVNFMPKNMVGIGAGLIAVSTALVILANALNKMGGMSWEEIAKGLVTLGGSMVILAIGLNAMNGTLAGSAAMLVAVAALAALTPVLSILGAMSWEAIAKGLVTIAGAFTVIGVAGAVLTPLIPTILALGGAFALIGVGVLGIGAGLLAAGAGLSALAVGFTALAAAGVAGATAVVASLTVIITGVAALIPAIIEKIGEGLIAFCNVIADGAPAIGKAIKAVVLTLIDVLVECVPAIAEGALELIAGVLKALVEYTPQIVDSIFQFLIGVLEGIARNLPGLIKAAIDVLMSFFSGIVDALSGIDTTALLKGIVGIGLLSAIMIALSAVAALVPGAMVGVLGMGLVIAKLALVLAAIGALAQIPGLKWLANEGAQLMEGIGNAIGSFIGGIVGGFMSGTSGQFPQIGSDLSAFMTNVQPFIEGARKIDASAMNGVKALAETILILTAANILEGLTSWFTGGSSMTKFGKELAEFAPYFKSYYESIKGIDGSVVESSANAAKSLAEMSNNLPKSGGVVGWITGESSLSAFADELSEFGPKLKAYADSVSGLDASVVINSANAAKALAEMANNLPNQGGVVGWFMGDNSLSNFADELSEFGPVLKTYADSVRGLDPNVVMNSANAAKALAEMSNNLPNQGGAVSWFTGDNTLSVFGTELQAFGPKLKAYSDSVRGLDANVVTNSANAAKALSELANNLPNSGGIASWFTGDNDIAAFGTKLVSFGQSFASYYSSVSTVNTSQLSGVIVEFKKLVDLATGISNVDTSGMATFSKNLTALGNSGIEGFIGAFTNANARVTTAASTMLTTFINAANAKKTSLTTTFTALIQAVITAINSKQFEFQTAGNNSMIKFIAGVKSQDNNARMTFTNIISGCLTAIKNKYYEFESAGQECMIKFIAGVKSKESSVRESFISSLSGVVSPIKDYYDQFYKAGKYLVEGFAEGISANTYMAEAKARAMARAAARAAEKELDEHSPSKVGYRIGDFFGVAFVNAIGDYEQKAYKAGAGIAESAKIGLSNVVSKIKDLINGDIDTQPTIRPVLDLSDVESGTGRLNTLFSRTQAMSISAGMSRVSGEEIQNGENKPVSGGTFSFVQNNYSPKPLSRIEIYRQTKNQISTMKGLVEA